MFCHLRHFGKSLPSVKHTLLGNRGLLTSRSYTKTLTASLINPNVQATEYAVRGQIVIRALELQSELQEKNNKLPFDEIYMCNIGNPHELGQKPITFARQVLSVCMNPDILDTGMIPKDVKKRALTLLGADRHLGGYTHSQGLPEVRKSVAEFIERRDGHPAEPDDIFLTDGASSGVKLLLSLLIASPECGLVIPVPQYPLYSASLALNNGTPIPYFLNEEKGWEADAAEVQRAVKEAKQNGIKPKAIVIINPGNPTGQCMTRDNIAEIIKISREENLVIMADEVYQENIYNPKLKFTSFKKVLRDLGSEYSDVELISFHSVSKGFFGECGSRGGYFETINIGDYAKEQLYKMASICLCPNIVGQIMTEVMVNPPKIGDQSFELYQRERDSIMDTLNRRAKIVSTSLNKVPGIACNEVDGALYAFPRIQLSEGAILEAEKRGMAADAFYCLELLEATGICCVPGSGFHQEAGTFHFRTTILPPEQKLKKVVASLADFHTTFSDKY